jgi:hypothetical protein
VIIPCACNSIRAAMNWFMSPMPSDRWPDVIRDAFLVIAVLVVGNIFLRLHTLPERMAHGSQKLQFEIVVVLGCWRCLRISMCSGWLGPARHDRFA